METNKPILDGIDPEIMDRLVSRREAIRKGAAASTMLTWGLSLGSVPVALAALSKDVYGQAPADILDALQFAFILENLENEFYKTVLTTTNPQSALFTTVRTAILANANLLAALQQIQTHEQQHVNFLKNTAIPLFGGTAPTITANDFDFTGGNGTGTGPFAAAGTNVDFLLLATQAFEDTGVRAYKGQAGRFLLATNTRNADVALEAALRIHSVEARHAAKIRRVRKARNTGDTALRFSGYVRGTGAAAAGTAGLTGVPAEVTAALNLIYGGASPEGNTSHIVFNDVANAQATIDAATMSGWTDGGTGETQAEAARMAFDEPLTKQEVIDIVKGFIKDDATRGLP
ncbi:MAG TPA: ferritin-like domain-containing protein [Gemmatimonadaceae bacterium]|nr:ferritin-like domain-containing protein [Gemmatimonadaceae bacterium]